MKSKLAAIYAILIAVLIAVPLVRAETLYSFTFVGPNVAEAANTIPGTHVKAGDLFRLTGSGVFDTSTDTASGGGSFEHINFDGSVHARGTWTVTAFVSFTPYGGPDPGKQGGLLRILIHGVNTDGETVNLMLQIVCLVGDAPLGAVEGVTVWTPNGAVAAFGIVVVGHTLFHLGA